MKDYYFSAPLKEKDKFAEKYRRKTYYDCLTEHSELLDCPAPLPKSNYCSICKVSFGHYYSHVRQKLHVRNEHRSFTSPYIEDLSGQYQGRGEVVGKRRRGRVVANKKGRKGLKGN
jgi:hypothetical protein